MTISPHVLVHLPYLSELKRQGSFTAAARVLHITQAAMSYQIKQLEQKLNCTLVIRRSGGPLLFSREGDVLVEEYQYCEKRLGRTLDHLNTSAQGGLIRISAPVDLGSMLMPKVIAQIHRTSPAFKIQLHVSDSIVDLQTTELDFAIRANSTEHTLPDEVLYRSPLRLVASADYFDTHPKPRGLSELKKHTLLLRDGTPSSSWNALLTKNKLPELAQEHTLSLGTTVGLREAAVEGLGIALLSEFVVRRELAEGRLVSLLDSKTKNTTACYRLARLPISQLDMAAETIKSAFKALR